MTWATKRKLTYLAGFLAALGIFIAAPVFLLTFKKPTCSDNRKNQGEQGIDCGGPCIKLCKASNREPVVSWQQSFKVAPGVYSAVAYVHNFNIDAEAFDVPYTFTLRDSRGQLIAERRGTAQIPSGGRPFVVFESGIQTGASVPTRTEFEFGADFNWLAARKNLPNLQPTNPVLSGASTSPAVTATIDNPSMTAVGPVDVTAIVYDTDGNAFAASKTYLESLPRNGYGRVMFTWRLPFARPVSKIEVIPVIR